MALNLEYPKQRQMAIKSQFLINFYTVGVKAYREARRFNQELDSV